MDGPTFLERVRRVPRLAAIPVVLISADRALVATAKALGVDGYLWKPVALENLLAVVERYCQAAGTLGSDPEVA